MTFTITIEDAASLAGIDAAKDAYNASLPEDTKPLATAQDYVQFVMSMAAQSYANQYKS